MAHRSSRAQFLSCPPLASCVTLDKLLDFFEEPQFIKWDSRLPFSRPENPAWLPLLSSSSYWGHKLKIMSLSLTEVLKEKLFFRFGEFFNDLFP